MITLTKTQQDALTYMLQHDWVCYKEREDSALNKLHDRGLVTWIHGNQKAHWRLTEKGLNIARRLRDE